MSNQSITSRLKSKYNTQGKFLGVHLEKLSQMEGGEGKMIKQEPLDSIDQGSVVIKIYGYRLSYAKGVSMRQALINYLGDPAWINLKQETT
jgi:hypothetical protein